jgi:hypothetical protein
MRLLAVGFQELRIEAVRDAGLAINTLGGTHSILDRTGLLTVVDRAILTAGRITG